MNKIGLFIGFCLLGLMYYGMVYHLSFIRSLPYFLKPQAILDFSWDYGFLRCLVDFLMGMLVFQIFDNQYFKPIFSNIIFAVFIVLGIAYTMHRAFSDVLSVMLFPTIILLAAYQNKLFDWFLDYPIFEKLGDWSYSIYLNQSCLLYVFVFFANVYGWKLNTLGFLNAWLFCLIYLIFLIVISTFTYQFIEKPCRKWFKNL